MTAIETFPAVQALCKQFVERADHLQYKGKKRDGAALDFMCGAASIARIDKNERLADHLDKIVWVVSVRGYAEVAVIAAKQAEAA
jgi:hypothetical protein